MVRVRVCEIEPRVLWECCSGYGADGFWRGGDGRGVFARLTAGAGAVLGGLVTARCVFARSTAGC